MSISCSNSITSWAPQEVLLSVLSAGAACSCLHKAVPAPSCRDNTVDHTAVRSSAQLKRCPQAKKRWSTPNGLYSLQTNCQSERLLVWLRMSKATKRDDFIMSAPDIASATLCSNHQCLSPNTSLTPLSPPHQSGVQCQCPLIALPGSDIILGHFSVPVTEPLKRACLLRAFLCCSIQQVCMAVLPLGLVVTI
eukprot:GHUV01038288.1.p1 GENE.GHUV01038288.1~~GHUV01038288.1.p1  ORF type:complete len:193 (-),score=31.27 GHUV01038288.1:114-692(-)